MKAVIIYLLQVIIASGVLYGYYHWVLRNKAFHHYNRYYLLAATIISLVVPFLNIPVYFTQEEASSSVVLETLTVISGTSTETPVVAGIDTPVTATFDWKILLGVSYFLVVAVLLIRAVLSLLRIRSIIRNNNIEPLDHIHFINTSEPGTPFSFFRWLFWNRDIELQSPKGQQIFRHEVFHIEQKHSRDSVFMELLTTIGWINPFFHLIKKELRTIHEFLADEFSIKENEKWQYAELLLMQAFQTQQRFVNPFFHNQIKRRIAMITTSKKPGHQYLRKLLVLPLAAIIVALFAFNYKSRKANAALPDDKAITVVIDAGHGGTDHGARSANGTLEKDLVLNIAQKIKALNQDKNINIILTRNGDALPSLPSRVQTAAQHKADLMISIHISTKSENANGISGMEVAIPAGNTTFDPQNRILASILLEEFSGIYDVNKSIVQAKKGIYILENSPCPVVLIECGYLSDQKDLAFISNSANQEKVARKILQAIREYAQDRSDDVVSLKQIPAEVVELRELDHNEMLADTSWNWRDALLVIDGRVIPENEARIKRNEIFTDTVHVLKGKAATDKYGEKGNKGVVEVITGNNTNGRKNNVDADVRMVADSIPDRLYLEPTFPGGDQKWQEYLRVNLKLSVPLENGAPPNAYTVVVMFRVDKKGDLSEIKALTKHGYGMEKEVIRLISKGPKWIPVTIDGRYVAAYKKQIVTFVVEGKRTAPIKTALEQNAATNPTVASISPQYKPVDNGNRIFEKVEKTAQFPGGQEKWKEYLKMNLDASIPVQRKAPDGEYTAVLQFIVNIDGTISSVKALTKNGYGLEEEAIRVLKNGPKWQPAVVNGKQVAAYKVQPVTFIVRRDEKNAKPEQNPATVNYPKISLASLKKATPYQLLQLAAGTEILHYKFTIDVENGDITESQNKGSEFTPATLQQINSATAGKLITLDMIKVKMNREEKKLPSLVYELVN